MAGQITEWSHHGETIDLTQLPDELLRSELCSSWHRPSSFVCDQHRILAPGAVSFDGGRSIPDSVSFRVWRNGGASAKNFAILSSAAGFTAGAALLQATYSDTGSGAQHTLTANIPVGSAIEGPIEYRLYAWNATAATGNTHVNLATFNAKFVAVPSLELNFNGVQDAAPLTALSRQDANVTITAGLSFGPGVAPRGSNNVGNEFHVAGFSTGSSSQSAIDNGDYLSFSVQPVAGMAMYPDSVSFTLWRDGSGSATDYATFSSIGGFVPGQQIAQTHLTTVGAANQLVLSGTTPGAPPTTDAVEFRLYGWNAASSLDSTHVVAASMRARFASIVGAPIDPAGALTVQGDLYHLDGGMIAIDLGGHAAGIDYDQINVFGKVGLEGDLTLSLADADGSPFAPALGDIFNIVTATLGVTGQFGQITFPQLPWNLDWHIDFLPTAVMLSVLTNGDFNHDGVVDSADYVVWRMNSGTQSEYNTWRANFGTTIATASATLVGSSTSTVVPEPVGILLWALGATGGFFNRRWTRMVADTTKK